MSGHLVVKQAPAPEILAARYNVTCQSDTGDTGDRCDESILVPGSDFWCQHAIALDLKDRSFRRANLSGATMCAARLARADLRGANLSAARLQGADLSHATLDGAVLTNTYLRAANMESVDLRRARLAGTYLDDAFLKGADLRGARLSMFDFSDLYFWAATLRHVDLQFANLEEADLTNGDLRGAVLAKARMSMATLAGANLAGAQMVGVDAGLVELSGADLRETNLWGADLTEANLSDTDLRGANLLEARLHEVDLSRARLQAADLRRVVWTVEPGGDSMQGARGTETDVRRNGDGKTGTNNARKSAVPSRMEFLKNAVVCDDDGLYSDLRRHYGPGALADVLYVVDCGEGSASVPEEVYNGVNMNLLALACEDEEGYVTEGIVRRSLSNRAFGVSLAKELLRERCPPVRRGLTRLSPELLERLQRRADGSDVSSRRS